MQADTGLGSSLIHASRDQVRALGSLINSPAFFKYESVWNFLAAYLLVSGAERVKHWRAICGSTVLPCGPEAVWLEGQPLSPRKERRGFSEGNTRVDIALGSILPRYSRSGKPAASGIRYGPHRSGSWVCFTEGKFFSDVSARTAHDDARNQIVRVLENLICFQGDLAFPEKLYFCLLTPERFRENPDATSYGSIMRQYENLQRITGDLKRSRIKRRDDPDWHYPGDWEDRLKLVGIRWAAYEDILRGEYQELAALDTTQLHGKDKYVIQALLRSAYHEALAP